MRGAGGGGEAGGLEKQDCSCGQSPGGPRASGPFLTLQRTWVWVEGLLPPRCPKGGVRAAEDT